MPPEGVVFRPKTDADRQFLCYVYATTRADEMRLVPWTDEQKIQFLEMQFNAQWSHYEQYFPEAAFLVIEKNGKPIGRIYIHRTPDEICLIDIALIPDARGAGLGTRLVQDILDEAESAGKNVTIHVERFNPAKRLYQRLGFQAVAENGVYDLMRWSPSPKVK